MTPDTAPKPPLERPDYGIDAPSVLRNLFLFGSLCLLLGLLPVFPLHLGIFVLGRSAFLWTAGFLLAEGCLFLFYVKVGKFRHRDLMLSLILWRGDEQVLDVGCGRGLLLAGAAKRLASLSGQGHATGIDLWSNVDMSANSVEAALHNLSLEGVSDRATVLSVPAQSMTFPDAHFNVIVSNLCLHNIYDHRIRLAALQHIVRVLAPGGTALISDYKLTREYAAEFGRAGLIVSKRRGNVLGTFPPLTIVIARKPL